MLRHKQLPAQANHYTLNPKLADLVQDNFINIPRINQAWVSTTPRRALLNNFGAAGSNVALLLEEYVEEAELNSSIPKSIQRTAFPFTISARSPQALQMMLKQYQERISEERGKYSIEDICYTTTARRQLYNYRFSTSCTSVEDLIAQISLEPSIALATENTQPVVFVFSGQGGSFYGMGKELFDSSDVFRENVTTCDKILDSLGMESIIPILTSTKSAAGSNEHGSDWGIQCACFVYEYALAKLWMSWGIVPDVVMGHRLVLSDIRLISHVLTDAMPSLGEYVALVISGVTELKDILQVVARRAILMGSLCATNSTGMLACQFSHEQAKQLIQSLPDCSSLAISCYNSPNSCVVSGSLTQLEFFAQHSSLLKLKTKFVDVPFAFHSEALDPIMGKFEEVVQTVKYNQPTIPLISSVSGSIMQSQDFTTSYLMRHTRQPVNFLDAIRTLQARNTAKAMIFLEIGPHPITLPMIETTLRSTSCSYLPSARKNWGSWNTISQSLAKLFLLFNGIKWREVFDGCGGKFVDLPGHPLSSTDYCLKFKESSGILEEQIEFKTGHLLTPTWLPQASDERTRVFQSELSILARYISGHSVGGVPICPASIYHEIVLEGAHSWIALDEGDVFVVKQIEFKAPLTYIPEYGQERIQIVLSKEQEGGLSFRISSTANAQKIQVEHCLGVVDRRNATCMVLEWASQAERSKRLTNSIFASNNSDFSIFQTRVLYQQIFTRVVDYSEDYHSLICLKMSGLGTDGYGCFQIRSQNERLIASPYFTDTLLHTAGFIANINADAAEICICSKVGQIRLLYNDIDWEGVFSIQCSLFLSFEDKKVIVADSMAFDATGKLVAFIEGMEFKKMQLNSLRTHLSRASRLPTDFHTTQRLENVQNANPRTLNTMTPSMSDTANNTPRSQDSVRDKVLAMVSKTCAVPLGQLNEDKHLSSLGIDSLMRLELADTLAQTFPHSAIDERIQAADTVQDLVDLFALPASRDPVDEQTNYQVSTSTTDVKSIEEGVLQILRITCGLGDSPISPEQDLGSLGVDSLMVIELVERLRESLSLHLTLDQLQSVRNIDQLLNIAFQSFVSQRMPSEDQSLTVNELDMEKYAQLLKLKHQPMQLQHSSSKKAPLFLFHDGSGLSNVYGKIGNLDRDVFAFSNPEFFQPELAPKTLGALAARYATDIQSRKQTSVILGGEHV